jgi:Peptidase family U32
VRAEPAFGRLGLRASVPAPAASAKRFPDGAHFRVEIPSVENLRVLEAVLAAASEHAITVNRVSQGSGAMLLSESELREMSIAGAEAGVEVSLFVGPREGYGVGAHPRSADGAAHAAQLRGVHGLSYAIEDVARAVEAGIRSFLVADAGLLLLLRDMQAEGELPRECGWKISVAMAPSNPAAVVVLDRLGATTINVPSDVTTAELAEMRAATQLPIDLYVESPDSLGGVVRGSELAELVAVGAPLYAKFGLRNSRLLYPAGEHLVEEAVAIARTKVARAAVALEWARRLDGALVQSAPGAEGLRVPQPVPVSGQPTVTVDTSPM